MIGILLSKIKTFIRNPWTFLLFTVMSTVFALMIGSSDPSSIQVPVYGEGGMKETPIGESLEENDVYSFQWMTEEEMMDMVKQGKAEVGVMIKEDTFQIMKGVESTNAEMVEQTVQGIYREKIQLEKIVETANVVSEEEKQIFLDDYESAMDSPIFTLNTNNFRSDDAHIYDSRFHTLFGFTLFFVIYTIAFNVLPILIEKKSGIWDRMILSPLKKWEMYVANLLYSFLEGYVQVLIIFFVFRYWVGLDFHGRFLEVLLLIIPYVFAIVALSIFITAIVKNTQQFSAVLPILAVSMAMIGGAYWPLEIVKSEFLLILAKLNPLTYGMEALQGVAVYNYSLDEILFPVSILILMGVVFMGLGIHLMERRHI